MIDQYKIIIVGGGPAGLATALHLSYTAPELIPQILILEAKSHPRPKLCGGGVTFHGEEQLERLGLAIDAPAFVINRLIFRLGKRSVDIRFPNAMRIFDRAEFDASIAKAVLNQGIEIHSNEAVTSVELLADGAVLTTSRATYHASIVIGADGAKSTIRRKLGMQNTVTIARLLRNMTPMNDSSDAEWHEQTAVFDFSCIFNGVQGYAWDFPCYINGQPFINRGIFDSRIDPDHNASQPHGTLKTTFVNRLRNRQVVNPENNLEGHPVRWFDPAAEFSRPHILLVGDAAGVDPLFAEGISYAMEYGEVAANTVVDALKTDDFTFTDYRDRLLNHRLGKLLKRRAAVARTLYRHRFAFFWSSLWWFASIAPKRVQQYFGASLALLPPRKLSSHAAPKSKEERRQRSR